MLAGHKSEILFEKYSSSKKAGCMTQVVECLPGKHKALSSNSHTKKKKKRLRINPEQIPELSAVSKFSCLYPGCALARLPEKSFLGTT
jgi:hypothetical protein